MLTTEHVVRVLLPIGKVLIPIGLGLFLRSIRLFGDDEGAMLRKFVVRFTVPIFVVFSLCEAKRESIAAIMPMTAALVLMSLALFFVGWGAACLLKEGPERAAVHACITFGNYGWMGLGVAQALLGDSGSQRVVYFFLLWWPVFYGLGLPIGRIHVGKQKGGIPLRRTIAIAAPPIIAVFVGLALNLCSVRLPPLATEIFKPFGDMTVPLVLLSVGMMLDVTRVRGEVRPALLVSAVTLVIGPVIGWVLAVLLTRDLVSWQVVILEGAMPVATVTPLLEENYEMDKDLVGAAIVLSTILSLVTLPIIAALIMG
jgi:predicted permease